MWRRRSRRCYTTRRDAYGHCAARQIRKQRRAAGNSSRIPIRCWRTHPAEETQFGNLNRAHRRKLVTPSGLSLSGRITVRIQEWPESSPDGRRLATPCAGLPISNEPPRAAIVWVTATIGITVLIATILSYEPWILWQPSRTHQVLVASHLRAIYEAAKEFRVRMDRWPESIHELIPPWENSLLRR